MASIIDNAGLPARPGVAADAVDDVVPGRVVTPESPAALAAALAMAADAGQQTIIRGGGTKIGWGKRPARVDLVVSTAGLNRLVAHRYGDLIAIVEAGARLREVNDALATHGQWLPIDSAFADATIGGILATNDSGPLRHRYGTPRDQLIGITLAMTDGHLVKAGGEVVKNVAGYDLGKLVTGSHGSFAAIATATFKLAPRIMASRTIRVRCAEAAEAAALIVQVSASQWEPLSFDLRAETGRPTIDLYVRLASTPDAVLAQAGNVAKALSVSGSVTVDVLDGVTEGELWCGQVADAWADDAMTLRCGWLPASADAVFGVLRELETHEGVRVMLAGRASVGAGHIRVVGEGLAQVRALARLRAAAHALDHVVVLRASRAVKDQVDVWGPLGDARIAMDALKRSFDPAGVLNAGRGPV